MAKQTKTTVSAFKEAGKSSTAIQGGIIYSSEQNASLRGVRKFDTFDNNLANISIIFSAVRLWTTLIASSEWFTEAADESAEAKRYAEELELIINNSQHPWVDTVKSAVLFKFNGFAVMEMTAKKLTNGIVGLHSIENRPARSIQRWDVDDSGNVNGFYQRLPLTAQEVFIPRSKVIYLVDNLLSDSPEGFGFFRAVAESAARLKELQVSEKIGIDRDLRGTPVGRAPVAAIINELMTNQGKTFEEALAEAKKITAPIADMVTLAKKGEVTGIVMDSAVYYSQSDNAQNATGNKQYDLEILSSQSSGLGEVDKVIRRITSEIARALGAEVLLIGEGTTGSLALSKDKSQTLMLTINSALQELAAQFNKDLVPFLARLNGWNENSLPTLVPSEVSQISVETVVTALRDLAGTGITLQRDDDAVQEVFRMLSLTPPEKLVTEGDIF